MDRCTCTLCQERSQGGSPWTRYLLLELLAGRVMGYQRSRSPRGCKQSSSKEALTIERVRI